VPDKAIAFAVIAALFALTVFGLWAALKDKKKGMQGGQAASLVRAGLMEAQNLLEPERKIEVVRAEETKRELLAAPSPSPGSPPEPLRPPPRESTSRKASGEGGGSPGTPPAPRS